MKDIWSAFHVIENEKKVRKLVDRLRLIRTIRQLVVAGMRTHEDTKFVLNVMSTPDTAPGEHVILWYWARFLPPWAAASFAKNVADVLRLGDSSFLTTTGLGVNACLATTPPRDFDKYFKDEKRCGFAIRHNMDKCADFCKKNGVRKSEIAPYGFQPANGLLCLSDRRRYFFPRRCYDVTPGSEATPARSDYVEL